MWLVAFCIEMVNCFFYCVFFFCFLVYCIDLIDWLDILIYLFVWFYVFFFCSMDMVIGNETIDRYEKKEKKNICFLFLNNSIPKYVLPSIHEFRLLIIIIIIIILLNYGHSNNNNNLWDLIFNSVFAHELNPRVVRGVLRGIKWNLAVLTMQKTVVFEATSTK